MNESRSENPSKAALTMVVLLTVVLFFSLFLSGGIGAFDFWWWMAANNVVLVGLALLLDKSFSRRIAADFRSDIPRQAGLGLLSALVLYLVFYVGNLLSGLILPGAAQGIEAVYGLKEGASGWRIALLMIFVFGPGEELFWRGFLQYNFSLRLGWLRGLVSATLIYTAVHVGSLNFMLVLAALICGAFWGWLYQWKKSLILNMLSHTTWDLAVFLLLPFR